jgi:uncharacterized membrane protein YdjX (TVP38/TMEM64 family)
MAGRITVGLIAISLLIILPRVPIGPLIEAFRGRIAGLWPWGPVVFGLIDVVAVVALVPGSALTLAAGALFDPLVAIATASVASTTGAALAFLIARYVARGRVLRMVRQDPRFEAIDRAVGRSDWKIVVLLRLSPAVPFNLQNYLYGVTGARFWAVTLASWVAMLPGTVLYVYLGHVGGAGLEAAAGAGTRTRTPFEWAMLAIGLAATAAITAYLAHLARRALREARPGARAEPDASRSHQAES